MKIDKIIFHNFNDLANNRLEQLPSEIGGLESLKSLGLDGNKLKELPASIANLKSLRKIQLRENPLESIPDALIKASIKIV